AHVPGNGVREILAATGAAARIGLKDRIAGPQQGDIERAAPDATGAPRPDRAAMNVDDDGAWAAVADGAQQPAMNFPAVFRRPGVVLGAAEGSERRFGALRAEPLHIRHLTAAEQRYGLRREEALHRKRAVARRGTRADERKIAIAA